MKRRARRTFIATTWPPPREAARERPWTAPSGAAAIHTALRSLGSAELEAVARFIERCARHRWVGQGHADEWQHRIRLQMQLRDLEARRSRVVSFRR